MKRCIFILWSVLGLAFPALCQIPSELTCVAGSSDMEAPTFNGATQKTRSWLCVDATGHVTSPVFAAPGGAVPFNAITGGTNTTAAMIVGTGATLSATGTGKVTASNLGSTVVAPNTVTLSPTTGTALSVFGPNTLSFTANGLNGVALTLDNTNGITLTNGTNSLVINNSGGTFNSAITVTSCTGCVGTPSFSVLSSGTNTTAAMVCGTGCSLITSGSGTITATNGGVTSVFGRTGAVVAATGDYGGVGITDAFGNSLLFNVSAAGANLLSSTGSGLAIDPILGNTVLSGNANATQLTLSSGQASFNTATIGLTAATSDSSTKFATTLYVVNKLATPTAIGSTTPSTGAFTTLKGTTFNTTTNCSSSAAPAVCGSAAAGSVVIPAAGTTVTVNTTAVTANSQIFLLADDTLGTKLSVTCNSTLATLIGGLAVTARTGGTSFQITSGATPAVNPLCLSYLIVN